MREWWEACADGRIYALLWSGADGDMSRGMRAKCADLLQSHELVFQRLLLLVTPRVLDPLLYIRLVLRLDLLLKLETAREDRS